MSEVYIARVTQSFAQGCHARCLFDDREATIPEPLPVGTIVRIEDADWFVEAEAGSARAIVFDVARRMRTPLYHDAETIAYADRLGHHAEDDDALEDLTGLPFVTIDNQDSRDLDQALFIDDEGDGFSVYYALADAAFYVRPGTPLFEAALARGVSYYYPSFAAPMLPPALSEGLVSLNAHVRRRALVFHSELDGTGAVKTTRLRRAFIRSRAKLAYDQVQRWHDHDDWPDEEWVSSLQALGRVGERRIALARDRNVIEFHRFEPRISFSDDGREFIVSARRRNDVEKWNEQISLLTNTEGARLLEAKSEHCEELHAIFRVHLPPLEQRLNELEETLDDLIDLLGLDDVWRWERGESLADYLANLPDDPEFARLRRAVERQVRWVNRASNFSARVGPHFALGVDHYARFTAPMREVVGIFTHKEALEGLGLITPGDRGADEALREKVIHAANAGNSLQKRIDKEIGLLAIRQHLGEDLELPSEQRPSRRGTIVGVSTTRIYLVLDSFPIDIKLYRDDLARISGVDYSPRPGAWVATDGEAPTLALGDSVDVITHEWNAEKRRYVFKAAKPENA